MSSIEFPQEVPDFIGDDYIELERRKRNEAYDDLDMFLGKAALIASETWPRSLHSFQFDEGEVLIRSKSIDAGSAGTCIYITVNDVLHTGAFGEHQLNIYDFLIACSHKAIAYERSFVKRDMHSHRWDVQEDTGPILQKKFDRVDEYWGDGYTLPDVRSVIQKNISIIDVIEEATAAEQLVSWLSLMNDISYEAYASHGI